MRARLYQCAGGVFEVVNCAGALFTLTPSGAGFVVKDCGTVADTWNGAGVLLKAIPNQIKRKFFELCKTSGITYSPSIEATNKHEIMSGGIFVGTVTQENETTFTARVMRHKTASFSTLKGALDYFGVCFPSGGANEAENEAEGLSNQMALF